MRFAVKSCTVRPERLAKALMDSLGPKIAQATRKKVEERLALVLCPIHHASPSITRSGSSSKIEFSVHGCCEALKEEITKALNR